MKIRIKSIFTDAFADKLKILYKINVLFAGIPNANKPMQNMFEKTKMLLHCKKIIGKFACPIVRTGQENFNLFGPVNFLKFSGNFNLFGQVNFRKFSGNFQDSSWKFSVFSPLNIYCSYLNS
jgi:hypothetical protein